MTVFPLTGGCNCGAVRFEMTAPLTRASYCHCKRCQRRRAADHLDQVMRSRLTGRNPAHGPTKLRPATKGASMTTTTPESTITELEDRLAIIELIGRLSLSIDAKHWDAMAQLFTDTVYHDRTSLTGGEPYTAPVAQFVEGGAKRCRRWTRSTTRSPITWSASTAMRRRAQPTCRARTCLPTRRVGRCGRSAVATSTSSSAPRTAGGSRD